MALKNANFGECVRCVAGLFLVLCSCGPVVSAAPSTTDLSLRDQAALTRAQAFGYDKVIALFLLKSNQQSDLRRFETEIRVKGGQVIFAESRIGYVRALVSIEQYEALLQGPGVAAVQIDGPDTDRGNIAPPYDPRSEASEDFKRVVEEQAKRIADRPLLNLSKERIGSPMVASSFLGLSPWLAAHPTFDGRGVTIVTAETLGDLLDHPSFRRALSLDGRCIPKIGAIFASPALLRGAVSEASADLLPLRAGELSKVTTIVPVHTDAEGSFTVDDRRYQAPAPGEYLYQQQSMGNGYYTPDDHLYSVLWRKGGKVAWVDANEDRRFGADELLGDFNQTHRVGHLPEAPSSMVAAGHPLAFLVYFDSSSGLPRLLAGDDAHSTWTAGAMAGHNFGGGAIGSAAPNAQLDAQFGATTEPRSVSQVLEGIMEGSFASGTDLFSSSTGTGDTMPHLPQSFAAQVLDRLINLTRKPQFWAAGNGYAETASVGGPSVASKVISVGAYIDAASLQALGGYSIGRTGFVAPYSYGPSNVGQMKPDLIAPMGGISTGPSWEPSAVPVGRLPAVGYNWLPGTSLSTPAAAAAAADLISGAKQSGIRYDAERINWAMKAGAQYLEDWPAQSQGAGLINLPTSWRMLTLAATWPEWRLAPKIDVQAPLHTRWTEFMGTSVGYGLYEREGWKPGAEGDRTITFVRRSGPSRPLHFWIQWLGNDGTFQIQGSKPGEIVLELGKPIELKVHIGPIRTGAHSATLELLDWDEHIPVSWTAFTVIAADQLTAGNEVPFVVEGSQIKEAAIPARHFINVPEGTQLLRIDVSGETENLQLIADHPQEAETHDQYSALERVWETPSNNRLLYENEKVPPRQRTYLAAVPNRGVWGFVLLDHAGWQVKPEPLSERYTFRTTALAASLTAAKNQSGLISIGVHNEMGALDNARIRIEIGTERHARFDSQHTFKTIEIPDDISSLWLRAISTRTHRPVRLWIYCDAQSSKNEPTLLEVPFDARPSVTVRRPKPGRWRIVVGKKDLLDGPVELDMVQTSTCYGAPILGADRPRRSGEVWQEKLPLPTNLPVSTTEAAPALLVELEDIGGDEKAMTAQDSPLPQRPAAIGQIVLKLDNQ